MQVVDWLVSYDELKRKGLPPRVELDQAGVVAAKEQLKHKRTLLNPKLDTEGKAKYILERLFGMEVRKDGDWATIPGGRTVYQKKLADFSLGVPCGDRYLTGYAEVKGISPGNNFQLSRLDVPNRKGQPSQHEKLSEAHRKGHITLLLLGWWDAPQGVRPVPNGDKKAWLRNHLSFSLAVIPWELWEGILPQLPGRAFRQKDRHLLSDCIVSKVDSRWQFAPGHWWIYFLK
jgi:hypothetical protein